MYSCALVVHGNYSAHFLSLVHEELSAIRVSDKRSVMFRYGEALADR